MIMLLIYSGSKPARMSPPKTSSMKDEPRPGTPVKSIVSFSSPESFLRAGIKWSSRKVVALYGPS